MLRESQEGLEKREAELRSRPVSIFIVRHFEPTLGYPEENPLDLEKAVPQAKRIAGEILEQCENGTLVFYGAGTEGRHKQSLELLKAELERLNQGREKVKMMNLSPTSVGRKSLRPVEFRQLGAPRGEETLYWLEKGGGKGARSPKKVAKGLTVLLNGLIKFSKRQAGESGVTWILITSGEVVAAWTKNLPEINESVGLGPGNWLRVDVPRGKFSGRAEMVHWKGISREISLTK